MINSSLGGACTQGVAPRDDLLIESINFSDDIFKNWHNISTRESQGAFDAEAPFPKLSMVSILKTLKFHEISILLSPDLRYEDLGRDPDWRAQLAILVSYSG